MAILIDLPGPKYRIGRLKGGQVVLKKGSQVRLTTEEIEGDASFMPVTLPNLSRDIKVGDNVILDDGAMQLKVQEIDGAEVQVPGYRRRAAHQGRGLVVPGYAHLRPFHHRPAARGHHLRHRAAAGFPGAFLRHRAPGISIDVRAILRENGADIPIIAKIERGEAVKNFNSILAASDGIMVARGDLGVEIPLEKVPLIQKEIIKKCNRAGKPVITATEMLESMIDSPRPTRAETTDVANAIFDGTDAVMLSAETAIGKYPVQAVRMMASIARATEKRLPYEQILAERRGLAGAGD